MKLQTMKQNIAKRQAQQGDVLLRRVDAMPQGEAKLTSKLRCVLAHGESGHSHVLESDGAEIWQVADRTFLNISKRATVLHEEHKPVTLERGIWEVGRVREYDYFQQMERKVMD